jgi:hypothetical protein
MPIGRGTALAFVSPVPRYRHRKARERFDFRGLLLIIPATSYSPTQLPGQYHRLEAAFRINFA